ncbi:GAF domain-containing protein [Anaerobacillus sp. MEB173]|uniref:GAF domain-containing protein n=1 Tax=Anaerobacillus sp. MEB173 TaxID=3383345 RepID=UPI003F9277C4
MGQDYSTSLQSLINDSNSDFAALAFVDSRKRHIHWKHVSGSCSQRLKKMVGKPGIDLSGMVVRFGDVMIVDNSDANINEKRLEFPSMVAEGLYSAMASPIAIDGQISAVLVVGSRTERTYTQADICLIKKEAERFASMIKAKLNIVT